MFALEKRVLEKALGAFEGLRIEHFGSTAVPGLAAKPIIDIMVTISRLDKWPRLVKPIEGLGYSYWAGNPKRDEMFFVKGMPPLGEKRTHHVHVYEWEGKRWLKELAFRNHLRNHPEDVAEYEALKRELAAKHAIDREAYTEAKTEFIQNILKELNVG